jgi:hypothetical protein
MRHDLEGSQEIEKRRYLRYEMLDYAAVRLTEPESEINAIIVDIGLGGLQLRTKGPVREGCSCIVEVGRYEAAPFLLRGEVRYSLPIDNSDLFATGIRFRPQNHEDRLAIAEYVHTVFRRQCELLAS